MSTGDNQSTTPTSERYDIEAIRKTLALMDPIPPETDMTLDTPPIADAAGHTQAERYDIDFDALVAFTEQFACVTEEALTAMKEMSYLEVAKIYEELWMLEKEANI